jgi:hypothetical protein
VSVAAAVGILILPGLLLVLHGTPPAVWFAGSDTVQLCRGMGKRLECHILPVDT